MTDDQVFTAVQMLNWHYGRGEVVSVDCARGRFTRKVPATQRAGFTETRRFRVSGCTVFTLGHRRKVQS